MGTHLYSWVESSNVDNIVLLKDYSQSCQPVTFKKSIIELEKTYFQGIK